MTRWKSVVAASMRSGKGARPPVRLTPAESRVLSLLETHLTLAAIGDRLGLSRSTVKTHVAHIYTKLEVGTRGAAGAQAQELGLLGVAETPRERRPARP